MNFNVTPQNSGLRLRINSSSTFGLHKDWTLEPGKGHLVYLAQNGESLAWNDGFEFSSVGLHHKTYLKNKVLRFVGLTATQSVFAVYPFMDDRCKKNPVCPLFYIKTRLRSTEVGFDVDGGAENSGHVFHIVETHAVIHFSIIVQLLLEAQEGVQERTHGYCGGKGCW